MLWQILYGVTEYKYQDIKAEDVTSVSSVSSGPDCLHVLPHPEPKPGEGLWERGARGAGQERGAAAAEGEGPSQDHPLLQRGDHGGVQHRWGGGGGEGGGEERPAVLPGRCGEGEERWRDGEKGRKVQFVFAAEVSCWLDVLCVAVKADLGSVLLVPHVESSDVHHLRFVHRRHYIHPEGNHEAVLQCGPQKLLYRRLEYLIICRTTKQLSSNTNSNSCFYTSVEPFWLPTGLLMNRLYFNTLAV